MAANAPALTPSAMAEQRTWLQDLRDKMVWLGLAALYVTALVLVGSPGQVRAAGQNYWLALAAFALLGLGVVARIWYRPAAAWIVVLGGLAVDLLAVLWGGMTPAIVFLAVPPGLALLALGAAPGLTLAGLTTVFVLFAPASILSLPAILRVITALLTWSIVATVGVMLDSLLTAIRWAWSSYERSQEALEQARDQKVQLYETMEDLTEANQQLTRLNRLAQGLRQVAEDERRAKEQFVANVSHELRTPLNMIIGFCEMITSAPQTYNGHIPPALLADLNVVLRNSQHLSALIDDVLDLSQIEAGRMALTKERVSLPDIIGAAVTAVRPLLMSKHLFLEVDLPQDLRPVFCDRTRIREVVLNLLSNAARFTEQGGVRVRACAEGDSVVVSVADTGPGISEEDRQRLFRPFEQLDGTIRRRYGGTGLGLSISKGFVELHEGEMWAESELGRGTTFFFRLPIDPPAPLDAGALRWLNPYAPYQERDRPVRFTAAPVRPRFVVVEPGQALQRLLQRYLDGAEVVAATSLAAAVVELGRTPAQALVLNDVGVGEALERVNAAGALPYDTPAIVCSIPESEHAADSFGASDYLVKPISRAALLAALDRVGKPVGVVLIVDDEPDALQLFGRMLTESGRGYRVLRAGNGRQALQILRYERPDVILLDLVMPDMDGFELLAARRSDPALQGIPVILISARDPLGQPIVSSGLAVTRHNGLSTHELLSCIESLSSILARANPPPESADPGRAAAPRG